MDPQPPVLQLQQLPFQSLLDSDDYEDHLFDQLLYSTPRNARFSDDSLSMSFTPVSPGIGIEPRASLANVHQLEVPVEVYWSDELNELDKADNSSYRAEESITESMTLSMSRL